MHQQPHQVGARSPRFLQQDAESLVREAVARYIEEQSAANKEALHDAVWKLAEFDPPMEEWKEHQRAPAQVFALSLMPKHLLWPDPFWGTTLF